MPRSRIYIISRHAITRYQQRVADVDAATAHRHLALIAAQGKRRSRPRHWMRTSSPPGTVYIYHLGLPGVCPLARGDTIVTVYTRTAIRAWQRRGMRPGSTRRQDRRRTAANAILGS